MSLRQDGRHGVRIARAEIRRSVRGYLRDTRRILGLAVAVLFFGGNLLFMLPTAYVLGQTARSATAIPYLGPAATALPIGLLLLGTFRTVERIGRIEAEDLVLTTVHPRAVVIGLVVAEIGRLTVWIGLPLFALATAFAFGLDAPSLLVSMGLIAVPIVCWGAVWGYTGGLVVLRLLRRLPNFQRLLKIGGIALLVVFVIASQFVGQYVVTEGFSLEALAATLTVRPLADYVVLGFLGTPLSRAPTPGSIATLATFVATTPVGLWIARRQASVLWFSDAPRSETARRPGRMSGGFGVPRPFQGSKAARIAWGRLVRLVRNPQEASHLLMIVFFLGPVGSTFFQSSGDATGPLVAGTGVALGTYLSGATFGLNPLGDDRPQLPLLLLTPTSPRTLVRSTVVAGLAVGLPVAVGVSMGSMLLGTSILQAIAFTLTGVATCLAASGFAVGLGSAYPIYEEREFWGSTTVVPSTLVMLGYTFVVGGGTVIGLLVLWFTLTGYLSTTVVFLAGLGVYLLLTFGTSYGSYRYAIRRYRRYTID